MYLDRAKFVSGRHHTVFLDDLILIWTGLVWGLEYLGHFIGKVTYLDLDLDLDIVVLD